MRRPANDISFKFIGASAPWRLRPISTMATRTYAHFETRRGAQAGQNKHNRRRRGKAGPLAYYKCLSGVGAASEEAPDACSGFKGT